MSESKTGSEYCNRFHIETPIDVINQFNKAILAVTFSVRPMRIGHMNLEMSTQGLTVAFYSPTELNAEDIGYILKKFEQRNIKTKYLAP